MKLLKAIIHFSSIHAQFKYHEHVLFSLTQSIKFYFFQYLSSCSRLNYSNRKNRNNFFCISLRFKISWTLWHTMEKMMMMKNLAKAGPASSKIREKSVNFWNKVFGRTELLIWMSTNFIYYRFCSMIYNVYTDKCDDTFTRFDLLPLSTKDDKLAKIIKSINMQSCIDFF